MPSNQEDWERYGRALHRAMAEVLQEFPEEARPNALETADYWIQRRPHDRAGASAPGSGAVGVDRGRRG
jgi:hypothetical protein